MLVHETNTCGLAARETAAWQAALRALDIAPGAAPRPVSRRGTETGVYRIGANVTPDARFLGVIPNPTIERFWLPEGFARFAQEAIGLRGGKLFWPLENLAQREGVIITRQARKSSRLSEELALMAGFDAALLLLKTSLTNPAL